MFLLVEGEVARAQGPARALGPEPGPWALGSGPVPRTLGSGT